MAMFMTWSHLAFIHWPIDAALARAMVPEPLEIDTHAGCAWIGLVPFTMPRVKHRLGSVPTMRHFHECNVRTYVRVGEERGVWFHSLDATSRLAVIGARLMWRLNYRSAKIDVHAKDHRVRYAVQRTDHTRSQHLDQPGVNLQIDQPAMQCTWEVGSLLARSQPGSLEHFLTERYALFSLDRAGRVRIGRIDHIPWPLREGRVIELNDSLVEAAGVPGEVISDVAPHVLASDSIDVRAWPLERLRP